LRQEATRRFLRPGWKPFTWCWRSRTLPRKPRWRSGGCL